MSDYDSLSKKYRETGKGKLSKKEVEAYIKARMPATLAACIEVLKKIPMPVHSMIDFGAGPGTGYMAAKEVFPQLERATLIEENKEMLGLSVRDPAVTWLHSSAENINPALHELGLFSYSFGELKDPLKVLGKAWISCDLMAIIEPGTPRGYENVMRARDHLIELGGQLIAPCPHMKQCPMRGKDWCHFSVRLARSKEHIQEKGAHLGYEDEKFSYVIFGKQKIQRHARVIRHPFKGKGHVKLELCTEDGLKQATITKVNKELYKCARKARWGDAFTS